MRPGLIALAALSLTAPAGAGTITIELPGEVDREQVDYDCAGSQVGVEYINADGNSIAVVQLQDGPVIMANVISASGARYAGRQYIWWTRGNEASLYDITEGEDADPVTCNAH